MGGVAIHENNNFQLDLAAEKLVEKVTEPEYRDESHWKSLRWWWTRVQRSNLRRSSEIIIIIKLPLPRHIFVPH